MMYAKPDLHEIPVLRLVLGPIEGPPDSFPPLTQPSDGVVLGLDG